MIRRVQLYQRPRTDRLAVRHVSLSRNPKFPTDMNIALLLSAIALSGGGGPNSGPANNPTPQRHRGMAPAWAASTTLAGVPGSLFAKPPGRGSGPMPAWAATSSNPSIADFSFTTFPSTHPFSGQPAGYPVEMDAFSTGRSRIPRHDIDGAPELTGPMTNWMAVAVSVSNNSNGAGSGHISRVRGDQIDPGAEIIAHYLDPNGALDPNLNDGTFVETRRSDLGFPQNGSQDVTSLDYPLGALTHNQTTAASILFTGEENVAYFSVSLDWFMNGNTANFADDISGNPVNAHPGDIYRMEYTSGAWERPTVHVSRFELAAGTTVDPNSVDVDALDLDADGEVILFSATRASAFDSQLMVMQRAGGTNPGNPSPLTSRPMMANASSRLTAKLEIVDVANIGDEADALCTFDPEKDTYDPLAGIAAPPLDWITSASLAYLWQTGKRVGLSSTRRQDVRPDTALPDDLHILMTGFGDPGAVDHESVMFFVGTDLGFAPITGWVPRVSIDPGNPTETVEIVLPIVASSGTIDAQVFAVIAAWDSANNLAPGYPRATWASTVRI